MKTLSQNVVLAMLFLFSQGCSQDPAVGASNIKGQAMTEQKIIRDRVKSFLTEWLIEGKPEKAIQYFGDSAFMNTVMLPGTCSSYIKVEERGSENARREGINKFLRDFLPPERKTNLSEVLNRKTITPIAAQLGKKVVNDSNADIFIIAGLSPDDLESSEETIYLRRHLPAHFYAAFVPIEEGIVYFLWIAEGKSWKIYHASLVCM